MIDYLAQYVVKDFYVSETKTGSKMGKLLLEKVKSKEILNCVLWQDAIDNVNPKTLRIGNTVKIITGEYKEQFKNANIRELALIDEVPIGLEKEEREKLFNNILEVVNGFKDKDLKNAVNQKISENAELFKVSPAAKINHHNYIGGLMKHIWECIEFAKTLFPLFIQNINQDAILAGCIMHDIGKMFEYNVNLETGIIDYDEDFRKEWISHTQYGFSWAMNNNLKLLARLIGAHHGRKDWEAIIDLNEKGLEFELYLIHHIDDLSGKFGLINLAKIEEKVRTQ